MVKPSTPDPTELLDPQFHAHGAPHTVWQWMRDSAPVYWHPPGQFPGFWSFTRHQDIRAVYMDPENYSSEGGVLLRPMAIGVDPGGGLTLALTDPPHHRELRAMIANWFTDRKCRRLEEVVRSRARELLSAAAEAGGCDIVHDVATPLTLSLTCHILGVDRSEESTLLDWAVEAFDDGRSLAAHPGFMSCMHDLMERRLVAPEQDLMSRLVHGEAGGRLLTEDEVLLNCENLVGATENAGLSLAAGILAFIKHPDQWERLTRDPAMMVTAVDEVLRWASSATHSMRTVRQRMVVHGKTLVPGDRVVLWLPSANRDERAFMHPHRFDITRRPNRHLALGAGEHVCIGAALARVQTSVLLQELMRSEFALELIESVSPLASLAVNGPARMPVRMGSATVTAGG
jgi:cytochrome P450